MSDVGSDRLRNTQGFLTKNVKEIFWDLKFLSEVTGRRKTRVSEPNFGRNVTWMILNIVCKFSSILKFNIAAFGPIMLYDWLNLEIWKCCLNIFFCRSDILDLCHCKTKFNIGSCDDNILDDWPTHIWKATKPSQSCFTYFG